MRVAHTRAALIEAVLLWRGWGGGGRAARKGRPVAGTVRGTWREIVLLRCRMPAGQDACTSWAYDASYARRMCNLQCGGQGCILVLGTALVTVLADVWLIVPVLAGCTHASSPGAGMDGPASLAFPLTGTVSTMYHYA